MRKRVLVLSAIVASISLFIGCGGDGSDDDLGSSKILYKLSEQGGVENYLFYGEVNPGALGSLNSVKVFSPNNPKVALIENNDTSDISYPVASTQLDYNQSSGTYSNLHMHNLSYVSQGKAYTISMLKGSNELGAAVQNSSVAKLSAPDYTDIDYLGVTQYLVAHDDDANKTVLILPDMNATTAAIDFGDRKLLSITYPTYGEPVDGYLVYNNESKKVERCSLDMVCSELLDAGSRDFEGDIAGTIYSAFMIDDVLYRVNKLDGTKEAISLDGKKIADAYGTTSFQDDSFYFISEDYNLYRVNLMDKKVSKVTKSADDRLERIRAFTDDWVIYGSDTLLLAGKKDGTSETPIVLAETTKTMGYKYVKDYDMAEDFLFVRYSVDTKTGDTRYQACIFNNGQVECRTDSFWAGVSLAKEGTLSLKSGLYYSPYAYIRVDETDSFGGGTLKAIDPKHPFSDGITMGKAPNYNFQTFFSNSRYLTQNIDSDGGIVLFAKNDTNFHVDSFYMNLLQEDSLVQLTNSEPTGISSGRDHCHGRHCMICHNFAGGKIYEDTNGTKAAYGYRVRLDFEDGTELLADISKGKGENFSMPIKKITGNFKANVLDANGTVVNSSVGYYHEGREYINCNYCHARDGKTRFEAPGAIKITK